MINQDTIISEVLAVNGNMETYCDKLREHGFRVYEDFIVCILAFTCGCNKTEVIRHLYRKNIIDFQDLVYFNSIDDKNFYNDYDLLITRVGKKIDLQTYKEFRTILEFKMIEKYCIANRLYNEDIIEYCSN